MISESKPAIIGGFLTAGTLVVSPVIAAPVNPVTPPASALAPILGLLAVGLVLGVLLTAVVIGWWTRTRRQVVIRRIRLAESRARRAEHLAEIGAMTGGLAHEIKNPLSTIGLNADLLSESITDLDISEADRGRLIRRVSAMRRETERLQDTLVDFLDFAGEKKLDVQAIDLNTVVDELVDFFHPQAQAAGVRLRADTPIALPRHGSHTDGPTRHTPLMVLGDTGQLKQALLNLMLNAVQAMAGQDLLSTSQSDAVGSAELIVRTGTAAFDDGRESGRVEVIDTGPGISGEQAEQIFVPYFTTKPGGSGLGLPTTRRIIHAMGGEIAVDSQLGRGTRFTIDLPMPDDPVAKPTND